jgi:hypothetical protein
MFSIYVCLACVCLGQTAQEKLILHAEQGPEQQLDI